MSSATTVVEVAVPVADPPVAPIVTRSLTKRYGTLTAVDRLDLELRPGEIFGLLGQNGAGKTTTILMLLGLTEPTEGEARVVGLDPARNPLEVKRRVGYLPDAVGFYGGMTGRQNLRYTARLNGLPDREIDSAVEDVLAQVGLADRGNDRVETYSRGMRQRLGIADALVKGPDILILDEPTTAIDPLGVVEILDLLRSLARDRGLTILLSSHLLSQVQSVCDRVGIFAAGRLIGQGTVEELAARFGDEHATIEVEFEDTLGDAAERARIEAALLGVPAVTGVTAPTRTGEPWRATVTPPDAQVVARQGILAAALSANLRLTGLRAVLPSLDDIYRTALARRQESRGLKAKPVARTDRPTSGPTAGSSSGAAGSAPGRPTSRPAPRRTCRIRRTRP